MKLMFVLFYFVMLPVFSNLLDIPSESVVLLMLKWHHSLRRQAEKRGGGDKTEVGDQSLRESPFQKLNLI